MEEEPEQNMICHSLACRFLAKERGIFSKVISPAPKILICKLAMLSYYRVVFFYQDKSSNFFTIQQIKKFSYCCFFHAAWKIILAFF